MNTWKVILATLVIFGAGVITGGLLVSHSDNVLRHARKPSVGEAPRHNSQAPAPVRDMRPLLAPNFLLRKDFLERLERELKLSGEQRERIEKIIGEGQERIKEIFKKIEPEVRGELAETRKKIRAELTPEQQALFTELLKRRPNPAKAGTNAPSPVSLTNSVRVNAP